jgi:hypothetical protein
MKVNHDGEATKHTKIIAGLEIIETEVRVDKPVFVEKIVEVPQYVQKEIEVPTGFDTFIDKVGDMIVDKVMKTIGPQLEKMVADRIPNVIEVPQVTYKEEIRVVTKEIEQEVIKPIIKEVEVIHANIKNINVTNAIVKDVPVINAIIEDVQVKNAVVTDQKVTNAIITNVEVTNAIVKHHTMDVIKPNYLHKEGCCAKADK